jgi:hypothetical protein
VLAAVVTQKILTSTTRVISSDGGGSPDESWSPEASDGRRVK